MDERIPWQFFDVTQIYNRELVTQYMPRPYPEELRLTVKPLFDGTRDSFQFTFLRGSRATTEENLGAASQHGGLGS
jgi:hypothetical protein